MRKRYNIFEGTNLWSEWRRAWLNWLKGHYIDEAIITTYEKQFAAVCDARYAFSFGAGRMAFYAILEALEIGEGDEVIIPAYTCVVVPNAILYRGAKPIYIDIRLDDFNIDTSLIEVAITSRTKALYAQHTFGYPCDVDRIKAIASKYRLPVIEDAAHALGMRYRGRIAGSLTEVSFFTTDHSKIINTHLGGMAVTNDDVLAAKLKGIQSRSPFPAKRIMRKQLQTFLAEHVLFQPSFLSVGRKIFSILYRLHLFFYFHDELTTLKPEGYPCRMSSAQANIGISQLQHLEKNIAHRRKIANYLENRIGWYKNGKYRDDAVWLRYSFLTRDRAALEKKLSAIFDLGIWFTSVVQGRDLELEKVGYCIGSCPNAEYASKHIFNFPTHPRIPFEMLCTMVDQQTLDIINSQINTAS